MRYLPVLLVWAISLLLPSISNADFVDCYFHLKCSPSTNRADIIPYRVYNKNVYDAAHKECKLKNGRIVRVKMGKGPTYPYGQDGATPEYWFSVWVDKAKVLSRATWGLSNNLRITITKDALKICGVQRNTHDIPEKKKGKGDIACKTIPNSKLHTLRDRLEYPCETDPIPPKPGTIVTLFAKDKNFCESFQRIANDDTGQYVNPPIDAVSKWDEKISQYEYCGHYRHFKLDINNDGHPEHIVALHSRTHYRDGDTYFIYGNNPPKILQPSEESESEFSYASKALVILPHNWSYPKKVATDFFGKHVTDDGYYSFRSSGSPWWDSTDKPEFRFRYWYLSLFRLKDVTYFLTASREADKSHWYGVLRPEPNGSVTEMCLFHRVRDRY